MDGLSPLLVIRNKKRFILFINFYFVALSPKGKGRCNRFPQLLQAHYCWFLWGRELEYPKKNPRSQIEIDKSQLTCGVQDSIPGHRGGRREWWPLRQPDSPVKGLSFLLLIMFLSFRSQLFFKQLASDLMAYCHHAGRRTIETADVELLIKR